MKALRLLAGLLIGAAIVAVAFWNAWLMPPESLARRVGLLTTLYPASTKGAVIEAIPCAPLPRLRFYVVCTEDCQGVWRIFAVKGLATIQLANLTRIPPESVLATRRRINEVIRSERVIMDDEKARQMVEFYLRVDGLAPERLLSEADRLAVDQTRAEGEEALKALAATLAEGDTAARIPIDRDDTGIIAAVLYWDTSRRGWPVLEMQFRLGGFGEVRDLRVRRLSTSETEEEGEGEGGG